MNKISGILPSSPRIQTVDLKEGPSVRPGAPSFGRPIGISNVQRNSIIRSAHAAINEHRDLMEQRSLSQVQADKAKELSESFFKRQAQRDQEQVLVRDILESEAAKSKANIEAVTGEKVEPSYLLSQEALVEEPEDLDQPEVGRYLDVNA